MISEWLNREIPSSDARLIGYVDDDVNVIRVCIELNGEQKILKEKHSGPHEHLDLDDVKMKYNGFVAKIMSRDEEQMKLWIANLFNNNE